MSRFPGIDPKAARATWTVALTVILLAAVYAIRGTIFVFVVALLFAYLLYPLVYRISSHFSSKKRVPALALTYLIFIGVLAAASIAIGARVVSEARQLAAHPPDIEGYFSGLQRAHPTLMPAIDAVQGRIRQQFGALVAATPRFGLEVLAASANLIYLVIVPILAFFMLKDGVQISESLISRFPAGESRTRARRTVAGIHSLLLSYMRALLLLCCNVLVVFSAVLSLMGVPYALLLSSLAFLCEFVPLLGPLTAAAVITIVSALTGYSHVFGLLGFLGVFRIVQDYIVSPRLMASGVELHPLLIIFGVFAGGEIGGVAGVFLSVPLLALGRFIFNILSE
jgi:predicted PurR-regulated permease PerM